MWDRVMGDWVLRAGAVVMGAVAVWQWLLRPLWEHVLGEQITALAGEIGVLSQTLADDRAERATQRQALDALGVRLDMVGRDMRTHLDDAAGDMRDLRGDIAATNARLDAWMIARRWPAPDPAQRQDPPERSS